jgi:predicted NAD/FAD-dependent oxidoreductase
LISVSIVGIPPSDDAVLCRQVVDELRGWFDSQVDEWRPLRVYRIAHALPRQEARQRGVIDAGGLVVCGDHVEDPSINGALLSGRRAADAVLARIAG